MNSQSKTKELSNNNNKTLLLLMFFKFAFKNDPGPQWYSGNTLASHLWDQSSNPSLPSYGKAGSFLLLVSSLHYRTLANCMYWFPPPFKLPGIIQSITNKVLYVTTVSWQNMWLPLGHWEPLKMLQQMCSTLTIGNWTFYANRNIYH